MSATLPSNFPMFPPKKWLELRRFSVPGWGMSSGCARGGGPRRRAPSARRDGNHRRQPTDSPTIRKIERVHHSPPRHPSKDLKKWLQIHGHCGMLCAVSAIGVAIGREHAQGKGALMVRNLRGVVSRIGIGVAAGALVLSVAAAGGWPVPHEAVPGGTLPVARWRRRPRKWRSSARRERASPGGSPRRRSAWAACTPRRTTRGTSVGSKQRFYEANLRHRRSEDQLGPCKDDPVGCSPTCPEVEQLSSRPGLRLCCR